MKRLHLSELKTPELAASEYRRYRDVKAWKIEVPTQLRNVNEVTRRATREPDYQVNQPYFSLFQKQIIALLVTVTAGFLLVIELGIFDFLVK